MKRAGLLLLLAAAVGAAQTASVEGKVTDAATGRALRNAEVLVRGLSPTGTPPEADNYTAETDGNGHFLIRDIAPGKYEVTASRTGFLSRIPGRPWEPGAVAIVKLSAGQPAAVALKLVPAGVISGRVVNTAGDPVSGASIEALQEAYGGNDSVDPGTVWWALPAGGRRRLEVRARLRTDDRGEYRFFDLAPGRYYLRITANTGSDLFQLVTQHAVQTFGITFYPAAHSAHEAAPLDVPPGGELRNIEIRVQQEMPHGIRAPVPGPHTNDFSIALQLEGDPESPTPFSMYSTNDETFMFDGVMPGSYVISTSIKDPAHPERTIFARQTVHVADRDVEGVVLQRIPMKTISGKVTSEGPTALQFGRMNVELTPENPDSPTVTARVAVDGSFTVQVLPESYVLTRPRVTVAYVKSVRMGKREAPDYRIDFSKMEGPMEIVLGTDGGKVAGIVKDADGRPAAYTRVTLVPAAGGRVRFTNTDEDGRFELTVVAPGEYKLFAWLDAELGAPLNAEFRKKYEDQGVRVVMDPKGTKEAEVRGIVTR